MTRDSLNRIGNLSSASVLHVFGDTARERPAAPGDFGLVMAMEPRYGADWCSGSGDTTMTSEVLYTALVGLVALERLAELVLGKRNMAWSLERAGHDAEFGHYPFMVVLHTGLPAGCLLELWWADRSLTAALGWPMLALVVASQTLCWWCIRTLGRQWNTRLVIVPDLTRVTGGPYRLLARSNYVAVDGGFASPLVHVAWVTAVFFTLLNAFLLRVRIRAENTALTEFATA